MDSWVPNLLHGLSLIIIIIYFYAQIVPHLASGSPFKLKSVSDMSSSVREHFLIFWHKVCQAQPVLSLLYPWNQLFLQGTLVPLSEERYSEVKIWILGMLTATSISLLPALSKNRSRLHVHAHTYDR